MIDFNQKVYICNNYFLFVQFYRLSRSLFAVIALVNAWTAQVRMPPIITTSKESLLTVVEGTSLDLNCTATGFPTPKVHSPPPDPARRPGIAHPLYRQHVLIWSCCRNLGGERIQLSNKPCYFAHLALLYLQNGWEAWTPLELNFLIKVDCTVGNQHLWKKDHSNLQWRRCWGLTVAHKALHTHNPKL